MYLNNLGNALKLQFERTRNSADFNRAISTKEQAVGCRTSPPSLRIQAANSASQLLIAHSSWGRANAILRAAVELMPKTSPRTLSQLDRQHQISQFAGVTSRAVSVSLLNGNTPAQALKLSELGNGLLTSLQLETRSDVTQLEEFNRDLAREFCNLREQLDPPLVNFTPSLSPSSSRDFETRRRLADRFDGILASIRQEKGFEQFLMGPSETEMRILAQLGPNVVFNTSEIRCDAFIVTVDQISSISLSLLTLPLLKEYTYRFLNAIQSITLRTQTSAESEIRNILKWLWDAAVAPILTQLGFLEVIPIVLMVRRIWWVGNGLLNVFPIHAAGHHSEGDNRNAMDQVISSYTPTIKALAYAREKKEQIVNTTPQKAALVGVPGAPEQEHLKFVQEEINKLNKFLSPCVQTTIISDPSKENVLHALRYHQIVYFACHGYLSTSDPSQSQLVLND